MKDEHKDSGLLVEKLPKWKVYFDGNFWGHSTGKRAGKEISTNTHFKIGDEKWLIPSIYLCAQGLVVDFCVQVKKKQVRDFMKKWKLSLKNSGADFTREQQMQMEAENPLQIGIAPEIVLNGKVVRNSHGCGLSWNPCFPEHNGAEAEHVLKQYALDPNSGWVVRRFAFPWITKRKPKMSSLDVRVKYYDVEALGLRFLAQAPGDCVDFVHPKTQAQHTLTVHEYEHETMPEGAFGGEDYEYPTHYDTISYTVSPELPDSSYYVRGFYYGDRPRKKQIDTFEPTSSADCAVGIIGGADGPTAIAFVSNEQEKLHAACSSLHFEAPGAVEWQMVFREKPHEDVTVNIDISPF